MNCLVISGTDLMCRHYEWFVLVATEHTCRTKLIYRIKLRKQIEYAKKISVSQLKLDHKHWKQWKLYQPQIVKYGERDENA